MAYAEKTNVSVEKTKAQIDELLTKHGATHQGMMSSPEGATMFFVMNDRRILFNLPLPNSEDKEFTKSKRGPRSNDAAFRAWEQACRSRWRSLFLCVKAKLESVVSGIETFDEAFLAHVVTPDGRKFIETAQPAIEQAYREGGPPQITFNPT